jgi:hypothetical protein
VRTAFIGNAEIGRLFLIPSLATKALFSIASSECAVRPTPTMESSSFTSNDPHSMFAYVQANPTPETVDAVVSALIDNVRQHPGSIDTIVQTTRSLLSLPSAQDLFIVDPEETYETYELPYSFIITLGEELRYLIHDVSLTDPKHIAIEPSNPVLVSSLLSAALIECHVLDTPSFSYAFTRQGLQLPDAAHEAEREEVTAIGGCLHLAIAGKTMMDKWLGESDGGEKVLQALKDLDEHEVIKYPQGKLLLKVRLRASDLSPVDCHFSCRTGLGVQVDRQ